MGEVLLSCRGCGHHTTRPLQSTPTPPYFHPQPCTRQERISCPLRCTYHRAPDPSSPPFRPHSVPPQFQSNTHTDTTPPPSYNQVGLIDRPSPGKVAYGVMVYQRQNKTVTDVLDQFTRLFDAIYSPEFTFVVHVDIKSDPALIELITKYVQRFSPQASTIASVSVSWGGVTVVERTLALMQAALERDPEWEYFVNIGQVCLCMVVCV
jgi:hypothetical protein